MSNLSLEEQHAIREAAGWFPWRSEGAGQPDTITGEVVALDSVWSDYRDELRILAVVRDDSGSTWSIRTYPNALHEAWLRRKPQMGERVSLKFTGMRQRKVDGKPYPDFSIAVERETAVFDYSRVGGGEATSEPEGESDSELGKEAIPSPADGAGKSDEDIPF